LLIDTKADHRLRNSVSEHNISLQKIEPPHWDDMPRLTDSLIRNLDTKTCRHKLLAIQTYCGERSHGRD